MRKDITIEKIMLGGEKMNKTALARQYGCCWETIDRRLNPEKYQKERKIRIYKSILDPYKNIIDEKLENNNIPATGIYFLLKNKYDYKGKYGIVRKYVSSKKENIISNLTIRFETIKGFQSQVDWKEKLKLHDTLGNEYIVSIFLIVLGNSRYKYIELTFDQTQQTLFRCLNNAFTFFGGTTNEILFDNMKTIVDQVKSRYYPSKMGINFGGYIIYKEYLLLRKRSIKKIRKKVWKWLNDSFNNVLDKKNMQLSWNSFLGHSKHAKSYLLRYNMYSKIKDINELIVFK